MPLKIILKGTKQVNQSQNLIAEQVLHIQMQST